MAPQDDARHATHPDGRPEHPESRLMDAAWIEDRLAGGPLAALLAEYGQVAPDSAAGRVGAALRRSAYALEMDPGMWRAQVAARLADAGEHGEDLARWAAGLVDEADRPALVAATPALTPADDPMAAVLTGHDTGNVRRLAVSADGGRAVSYDMGKHTAYAWDLVRHDGRRLAGDENGRFVYSVAISADGRRAVTGGRAGLVLCDLTGEAEPVRVSRGHPVRAVAISADGTRAVSGGGPSDADVWLSSKTPVWLWDLTGGEDHRLLGQHEDDVSVAAISADGTRAVTGARDGRVLAWDLTGEAGPRVLGRHEATAHQGVPAVYQVEVCADGRRAVSRGSDRKVRAWDLTGRDEPRLLGDPGTDVASTAISADGTRAVTGGIDGAIVLWDLTGGSGPRPLGRHDPRGPLAMVEAVAISPDGSRVVSGGHDGTVRLWDTTGGAGPRVLGEHAGTVYTTAISADGRRAVSGGTDRTVRVWELTLPDETGPAGDGAASVCGGAVSADGTRAVTHHADNTVRAWDLTGRSGPVVVGDQRSDRHMVAVSADGARAVTGGGYGWGRVWDLAGGAGPFDLDGPNVPTYSLAMSGDGRRIVVASDTKKVHVWDPAVHTSTRPVPADRTLSGATGKIRVVAVSLDGTHVAGGGDDGSVRVWNLAGPRVRSAPLPPGPGVPITSLAVSTDGAFVLAGCRDGRALRWDVAARAVPDVLAGSHDGPVTAAALSADGGYAVTCGEDRTLRLWGMPAGTEIARWVADGPVAGCAVTGDDPLTIGVAQQWGAPYLLRLRDG